MKQITRLLLIVFCFLFFMQQTFGYGLPSLNLGVTNFLDGGPIRPRPGWYWFEYLQYYQTHKFLDADGKNLDGIRSPTYKRAEIISQVVYQFENPLLFKGIPGFTLTSIPYIFYSHVDKNSLGFSSSGSGFGSLTLGAYLQWKPIYWRGRPFFEHRLELDISLPVGKNKLPMDNLNPGSNFITLSPFWAATCYITEKIAASWRLYFLWCAKDKKVQKKAGDSTFLNFSLGYFFSENALGGLNGYFLEQLQDNKVMGITVPESREQVLGLGPGGLYYFNRDLIVFGHYYFETLVRNRTQGSRFVVRFVKHF